jgi:hypothetical protein
MIVGNKSRKISSKIIKKDKEGLMGLSILGLSGFHICDLCDKKAVPAFFKKKRLKKAVLV